MIQYSRIVLGNGLVVLIHQDKDTPLVTLNTLYKVGSCNENPQRTGFAHLFEHLMFGGTAAVPDYDGVVTSLCGDSNAFTNTDYTNYYVTAPAEHLEQLMYLESDRMRGISFDPEVLRVQQHVVTEEYNQRYINQPYGDTWLLLRPLCYKQHPYRWSTIGADIRHVQQATVDDEREFFATFYRPDNAILAVAGNVDVDEVARLADKYYGDIMPDRPLGIPPLPVEPEPAEPHRLEVQRKVPNVAIYKAYLMCDKMHPDFVAFDLLSDVLCNGKSSRMYNDLVKRSGLFVDADAVITGARYQGLFYLSAKLEPGADVDKAERMLDEQLQRLVEEPVSDYELSKVVSKYESTFAFSRYKCSDRAQSLCYFDWLGHADWVNTEPELYKEVTSSQMMHAAQQCFQPHRCNTLIIRN